MIPLGLYRRETVNLNAFREEDERKKSAQSQDKQQQQKPTYKEIKYVVTNPPRHVKLQADDLVFVLS
jgi:hypothetical protein